VRYSYQVAGRSYHSRRYDLWDNRKGDAGAIVGSLAPGQRVRCFHDRERPGDAVIDRRLDPVRLLSLFAVLPLAFGVHLGRRPGGRVTGWGASAGGTSSSSARGPRRLGLRRLGASIASRLALYGLCGPALLALCLHDRGGILGELARGELSLMPGLWVVILLVAMLAATALFVHTVMRALGPRFALATVQPARAGSAVTLQWRAAGVTPSIRRLSLALVGREEADYERRVGDSKESGTETNEFHRQSLVELARADRPRLSHGSVAIEIPPFAFSFDGGHNRIRWVVELRADVAAWADVHEELELDVAPMKSGLAIEAPGPGGARRDPGGRGALAAGPGARTPRSLRLVWTTAGAGLPDEHVVETVDIAGLPAADPAEAVAEGPYRGVQATDALAPGPSRPGRPSLPPARPALAAFVPRHAHPPRLADRGGGRRGDRHARARHRARRPGLIQLP
jgi:hypothetical protein